MTKATQRLDATFHALADPTRREILRRLGRGEARVTDMAAPFRISLNSVSKHIRVLEQAGLIDVRQVGRERRLRGRPRALEAAQAWIAAQQAFWQGGLEALDAALQAGGPPDKESI